MATPHSDAIVMSLRMSARLRRSSLDASSADGLCPLGHVAGGVSNHLGPKNHVACFAEANSEAGQLRLFSSLGLFSPLIW